jgi:hypothetical protein
MQEAKTRGSQFEVSLDKKKKKKVRLSKNKLCKVVHACNPSYTGGRGRRTVV